MWVGLKKDNMGLYHWVEGLNREKTDLAQRRWNSATRLPLESNYTSCLGLQPMAYHPCRLWTWTEELGGLQSMGLLRVGHGWAPSLSLSISCIGEGNGNPLQCSCLENPKDRGAWWAAIYGVTQSRTRLKSLSSRSSSKYTLVLNS